MRFALILIVGSFFRKKNIFVVYRFIVCTAWDFRLASSMKYVIFVAFGYCSTYDTLYFRSFLFFYAQSFDISLQHYSSAVFPVVASTFYWISVIYTLRLANRWIYCSIVVRSIKHLLKWNLPLHAVWADVMKVQKGTVCMWWWAAHLPEILKISNCIEFLLPHRNRG